MNEEIFGPILPVLGSSRLDEAIAFVNDRPTSRSRCTCSADDDRRRRSRSSTARRPAASRSTTRCSTSPSPTSRSAASARAGSAATTGSSDSNGSPTSSPCCGVSTWPDPEHRLPAVHQLQGVAAAQDALRRSEALEAPDHWARQIGVHRGRPASTADAARPRPVPPDRASPARTRIRVAATLRSVADRQRQTVVCERSAVPVGERLVHARIATPALGVASSASRGPTPDGPCTADPSRSATDRHRSTSAHCPDGHRHGTARHPLGSHLPASVRARRRRPRGRDGRRASSSSDPVRAAASRSPTTGSPVGSGIGYPTGTTREREFVDRRTAGADADPVDRVRTWRHSLPRRDRDAVERTREPVDRRHGGHAVLDQHGDEFVARAQEPQWRCPTRRTTDATGRTVRSCRAG